ncbi:hypothetical protein HBB16_07830 [Pseudonocardia sp. MCCB 268]|nr:hypothetical protein [Pseudonocardia cytotoxica]
MQWSATLTSCAQRPNTVASVSQDDQPRSCFTATRPGRTAAGPVVGPGARPAARFPLPETTRNWAGLLGVPRPCGRTPPGAAQRPVESAPWPARSPTAGRPARQDPAARDRLVTGSGATPSPGRAPSRPARQA